MSRPLRIAACAAALSLAFAADDTPLQRALRGADLALQSKDYAQAKKLVDRALERDAKAPAAWGLRARWAEGMGDRDEQVYALHVQLRLLNAQKAPAAEQEAVRKKVEELDPFAQEFWKLKKTFIEKLVPIADRYEKEKRPHSAIRTHRILLALDPDRAASEEAIHRISAAPDPSLAETAKPKDLLADVSEEWIHAHDAQHNTWETRDELKRDNYTTTTDSGYAVLVRAGEAMEQMNAFYRQSFRYGGPDDKHKVSRIEVHIFKTRDEYLKLGTGPPVEWSGGQFTGGAVETYISDGGFEGMVTTLFHEAAHQFVSLATSAAGWLNEGLASYFEGSRILNNGTVIMNLPANHRLFPLADRMSKGWMATAADGIDPTNPSKSEPEKSPTFRIVLENEYAWGPPWYAPTWGVVYFLWNYQDPVDGRFVYRNAFRTFINTSGGRIGKGAIQNFEKVVLANPEPPTPKLDPKIWKQAIALPKDVDELTEVWKTWMLDLRDEQSGKVAKAKPYLQWARYALQRKDADAAAEQFEKGILASPDDIECLTEFAKLLAKEYKNPDRATKLTLQALRAAEAKNPVDEAAIKRCEGLIVQWDPNYMTLELIQKSLGSAARNVARRYLAAGLPMMTMDLSWHLAADMGLTDLYDDYETAMKRSGKSLALWKLAYNEKNLEGWAIPGTTTYQPAGEELATANGAFAEDQFSFQFLTVDTVTSGDFSMETEVTAEAGKVNFCGVVFGKKSESSFHAFIYFPPRGTGAATGTAYVDLTSFYGGGQHRIWRHNPVKAGPPRPPSGVDETAAAVWHRLRVDVTGRLVDVWFDGEWVVTQEFPSIDVLRGSFGLISGPGAARYRNVRYLARPARDRAAELEREMRLGSHTKGADGTGGSWLEAVPPFPRVESWVQGKRAGWHDRGAVPTLLVFWSIRQNDLIPIHEWLAALAKKYEDVGLEIVAVASQESGREVPKYLETHPFPGSVAIDSHARSIYGDTHSDYGVEKFGMPRVVLLDVDHRVVWEGDPGFKSGQKWQAGQESYVETPLEELVAKRKIREVAKWTKEWQEKGLPALRAGDFAAALPALKGARTLEASGHPVVTDAAAKLSAVEAALASLDHAAREMGDLHCEPALAVLLAWGKAIEKPVDTKYKPLAASIAESPDVKAWNFTLEVLKSHKSKLAPGKEVEVGKKIVEKLDPLEGTFPGELARALQSLVGYDDAAGIVKLLGEADRAPAQWLATQYFRW